MSESFCRVGVYEIITLPDIILGYPMGLKVVIHRDGNILGLKVVIHRDGNILGLKVFLSAWVKIDSRGRLVTPLGFSSKLA